MDAIELRTRLQRHYIKPGQELADNTAICFVNTSFIGLIHGRHYDRAAIRTQ